MKNLARVQLNGKNLGVVWTAPWRVDITGVVKPGANDLVCAFAVSDSAVYVGGFMSGGIERVSR